jgi:hypothetical protein
MNVGVGKTPWAIEHRLVAGLNYTANWFNNAPTNFHYSIKSIQEEDLVMYLMELMMVT